MFRLLENVIIKKLKVDIFSHVPSEKTIPQVLSITHSGTGRGKLTIPRQCLSKISFKSQYLKKIYFLPQQKGRGRDYEGSAKPKIGYVISSTNRLCCCKPDQLVTEFFFNFCLCFWFYCRKNILRFYMCLVLFIKLRTLLSFARCNFNKELFMQSTLIP